MRPRLMILKLKFQQIDACGHCELQDLRDVDVPATKIVISLREGGLRMYYDILHMRS